MICLCSPFPSDHSFPHLRMSGSRHPSRSRLPTSDTDLLDELQHGHARIQEVASALRGITPLNFTQAHAPRAMVTSSIDTISSDPGTYTSSVSHQTSSDYTTPLVSSPANLDSMVARGQEPWADSNLINTMSWENSATWSDYGEMHFAQDQFTGWQQPPLDTGWHVERPPTAPVRTTVSSPALSPVTRQSLVGYRKLQQSTTTLTNLDASTEVPYPIVYNDPQPSVSNARTTQNTPFREATEPLPTHTDSEQDEITGKDRQPVLPSDVEEAVIDANQRRKEKARQVRSRSAAPSGVSRTKISKVSKGRQRALSPKTKLKAEDMRYYGACWRCRKYKKPVR